MNRMPVLADHLGFELLQVAKAMADGSYWRPERDAQIEYCGEGKIYENWSGGEGAE